jgi:ATP-dependent DNA helicase DinG
VSDLLSPQPRAGSGRAVLVAGFAEAAWLTPDGRVEVLEPVLAARRALVEAPIVCHAPATFRKLKSQRAPVADILELYAFVRPASFCLPTPRGIALAMGLPLADHAPLADQARLLAQAARALLGELAATMSKRRRISGLATLMARAGWVWGPDVQKALEIGGPLSSQAGVAVWEDLPEWQDQAPEPAPSDLAVEPAETRRRLADLLGPEAEQRPQQADYAESLVPAFAPRPAEDAPNVVLAEAGTGVGKTLGYLAPAGLWAERNKGAVWISTFTRHLQNQIDQELDRLYPNPALKAARVVLRKGRENYLCLLNLAELSGPAALRTQDAVAFGLMARWTMATRDGDLAGGDLPGWLGDILGASRIGNLADRRGECVYSACPHYGRCFIERSVRRARKADIVIANHALVMIQAALGSEDQRLPTRYVFDEGHHLFEAIDSAFAAHLTGQETIDLRRWLLGGEGSGRAARARGLRRRVEDLILDDAGAMDLMRDIAEAARALPGDGWLQRLQDRRPNGAVEMFLHALRQEVLARAADDMMGYGQEIDARPVNETVLSAALALDRDLQRLQTPMRELAKRLAKRLDDDADVLDSNTRLRIDAMVRGITRRADMEVAAWRAMLQSLAQPMPPEFVDWFAIERVEGRELDVGFYRHYLDPTKPFIDAVAKPAHGVVVTSATLTDGSGSEASWDAAGQRVGAPHLVAPAMRVRVPSPFDYAKQTRVFIVTDVPRTDTAQVASAYRELFLAAGGGALGLFTAIARLREVHKRIAPALEQAGLDLLSQHVDAMSTASLIDIFRGERDACLLGTDAIRDGVDVPGPALRLIVFDRVPWPRPHLLHRARKSVFGGTDYDDQLVRLKLKQAFGRLIRRADDRGVFVLLDRQMPSRLLGAFPAEIAAERIGLAEAIEKTRAFLAPYQTPR